MYVADCDVKPQTKSPGMLHLSSSKKHELMFRFLCAADTNSSTFDLNVQILPMSENSLIIIAVRRKDNNTFALHVIFLCILYLHLEFLIR